MSAIIPADRIASVAGYGMTVAHTGYVYRPTRIEEIRQVFELARNTGRKVLLRGAGRSYGDGNIAPESLVLDISRMRRILDWDPTTGVIDCEGGVTIEGLWRHVLEDGYWPPVVSGTMFPTLAGALGMNIHGKNNFRVGTLGDQVIDLDVLLPNGEKRTLTPKDPLFYGVISGAGLLGVIVRVKLKMKKIDSGDLRVYARSCHNWDDQFAVFEEFEDNADYMVSWVDLFGRGKHAGRGLFHAAWYVHDDTNAQVSLRPEHQDLPDTILGLVPKSMVWRFLKPLNNRWGMHFINWAKHMSSVVLAPEANHHQSLVAFSFLLDYVPNWRNAYLPGGFIQYQTFVPKEHARRVFEEQMQLQQEAKLESFLGVMKRHKPDKFLFSHAVDGYSLAQDFKVTKKNWPRLQELCHRMNDITLAAGGRFYFAKDSTLRPQDAKAYLGAETLATFQKFKREVDPEWVLTSSLAERLKLV